MSAIHWHREAAPSSPGAASRPFWSQYLHGRRQDRRDAEKAAYLAQRFITAATQLGLSRHTESWGGIPGVASPRVTAVRLGVSARLLVEMMPGQVPADYRAVSAGLAEALRAHSVRITRRSHGYIFVELQEKDALDARVTLPGPLAMADHELLLGGLDNGAELRVRLSELSHTLIQGQTRSGKSRFLYGLLSQLADARDVLICGSDITNLVLRPFAGTRHGHLIAAGSAKPEEHAEVLEELVSIMDDRIARMPDDLDVFPCTEEDPYMVGVLEELPGLLRLAARQKTLSDRIKVAYGRLVSEGAKAGFRLVLVAQRADATIIGGYERGQCPLKISFSTDDPAAVRMCHPAASDDLVDVHMSVAPGRALVSMPGLPVARLRAPEMASYQDYRTNVAQPLVTESETADA